MKKTTLLIAVCLLPFAALQAQDLLFGGSVAFDHSKSETTFKAATSTTVDGPTSSSFEFSPFGGVFLSDKFLVGLGLGYESTKVTDTDVSMADEYIESSNLTSIMPFVRYYYMPTENAGLFLHGSVGVGFGKDKEELKDGSVTESYESDVFGIAIGIVPGLVIYVTDYLGLEASYGGLEYASFTRKAESNDTSTEYKGSGFSFSFNPSFFKFGVVVKLGE